MTCEYDMTRADAAAAQKAVAKPDATGQPPQASSKKFSRGLIGWMLFVGLAVMLFTMLNNAADPTTAPAPARAEAKSRNATLLRAGTAFSALGVLLVLGLIALALYLRRSRRGLANGRVAVRLDESEVVMTTAYRQDTLRWDAMLDVVETDRMFVLPNVGPHPLVLPKRGFASSGEVDAARAILAERVVRTAQRAPA